MAISTGHDKLIQILCTAIQQRKLIKFYYESVSSKKKGWRLVEPYILGIKDNGAGNIFLAALPISERAKKLEQRVTGHYLLDKIDCNLLEILEDTFDEPKVARHRIVTTPTISVLCRFKYDDDIRSVDWLDLEREVNAVIIGFPEDKSKIIRWAKVTDK